MSSENEQEGNGQAAPPHADLFEDNENNSLPAGDDEADDDGSSEEDNNVAEHQHHLETVETLIDDLQRVKNNDPTVKEVDAGGSNDLFRVMSGKDWEQLGWGITKSDFLETLFLYEGALDDQRMISFSRGLMRSDSIRRISVCSNGLSDTGFSMLVPFLQNISHLTLLNISGNNITSEGFSSLLMALSDSPIKELYCGGGDLEDFDIYVDEFPRDMSVLNLQENNINADGCRELGKLLEQGNNFALRELYLDTNNIDDEGLEILVGALENNTSLEYLNLQNNGGISIKGLKRLLKLLNDVSTIKATLRSNHTLQTTGLSTDDEPNEIERHIFHALQINQDNTGNSKAAGRDKVIHTQLNSTTRKELCGHQGIDTRNVIYSQINSLHLPEVLSLISRTLGQKELYVALVSSVASLFSTVNRDECLEQQWDERERLLQQQSAHYTAEAVRYALISAEHAATAERMRAELVAIRRERDIREVRAGSRRETNRKRRRLFD